VTRANISTAIIGVLLIFSAMFAIPISSSLAQSTSPTSSQNPDDQLQLLQQQQQQIQKQIQSMSKQVNQFHKDTLFTANLTTPTVNTTAYTKLKHCSTNQAEPAIGSPVFKDWWKIYLTDFKCGHITKTFPNNNTAEREFTLIARDYGGFGNYIKISKNISDPVLFPSWSFNNTVPGPTLRMTQGDHVKIKVINDQSSKFPHSFHMHSIHSGAMDGMFGMGGMIAPGTSFTYEFIARPAGLYPYHCHMEPVTQHIQHGLYGAMIIDSPTPRPKAVEMVMMMNAFSFNQINLVNPQNTAPKPILPATAQQLRDATQDFGMPGVQTANGQLSATGLIPDGVTEPGVQAKANQMIAQIQSQDGAGTNTNNNNNNDPPQAQQQQQPLALGGDTTNNNNNNNNNEKDNGHGPKDKAMDQQDQQQQQQQQQEQKQPAENPAAQVLEDQRDDNQFYAVNSMSFGYSGKDAIHLVTNQSYRIYLVNMVEFDPVNSFHLHGNLFLYYPSGTSLKPAFMNDIVVLGQGDRGILEFSYNLPGKYMFHAHVNEFTNLGWLGVFDVSRPTTVARVL
jgi:FtsP/CotA-like multicopper oxidase with cupredoxin domain